MRWGAAPGPRRHTGSPRSRPTCAALNTATVSPAWSRTVERFNRVCEVDASGRGRHPLRLAPPSLSGATVPLRGVGRLVDFATLYAGPDLAGLVFREGGQALHSTAQHPRAYGVMLCARNTAPRELAVKGGGACAAQGTALLGVLAGHAQADRPQRARGLLAVGGLKAPPGPHLQGAQAVEDAYLDGAPGLGVHHRHREVSVQCRPEVTFANLGVLVDQAGLGVALLAGHPSLLRRGQVSKVPLLI